MSNQDTTIQRVCAWCGNDMGTKPGDGQEGTTHDICEECEAKQLEVQDIVGDLLDKHKLIRDLMGVVRNLLPLLNTAEVLGEWEALDINHHRGATEREKLIAGVEAARAMLRRAKEAGYDKEDHV